jgi:hypothetical protein
MIASLKAGGTGLNLTMANKCILVDLWWNEAVEQQVKDNSFLHNVVILMAISTGLLQAL